MRQKEEAFNKKIADQHNSLQEGFELKLRSLEEEFAISKRSEEDIVRRELESQDGIIEDLRREVRLLGEKNQQQILRQTQTESQMDSQEKEYQMRVAELESVVK